jgi:hypothetical protein
MTTIFFLWFIASILSMLFLAKWAYDNWKVSDKRILRKSRVHCTHFIKIK